jgi:hypothetical protein
MDRIQQKFCVVTMLQRNASAWSERVIVRHVKTTDILWRCNTEICGELLLTTILTHRPNMNAAVVVEWCMYPDAVLKIVSVDVTTAKFATDIGIIK